MSTYPPGGDYDARLLDSAPKATRAEKQEGYNVNLLASDNSESPMNPRPPTAVTHDGHGSLETGVPPNKEGYISSHPPVPWYRQNRWRIAMLIGAIIVIGAVVGGAVGGTVGSKNRTTTPSKPLTVVLSSTSSTTTTPSGGSTVVNGAPPPASSQLPVNTSTGGAVSTQAGGGARPSDIPVGNVNLEGNADTNRGTAPVVADG